MLNAFGRKPHSDEPKVNSEDCMSPDVGRGARHHERSVTPLNAASMSLSHTCAGQNPPPPLPASEGDTIVSVGPSPSALLAAASG